eukprot:COSAG03_NODE_14067_length_478_cov_0.944591_1_plen_158_part_11
MGAPQSEARRDTEKDRERLVIERGTLELTGCLLANRCRADALLTAEAILSAQSTEGRRLTVSEEHTERDMQDAQTEEETESTPSVAVGEAHMSISSTEGDGDRQTETAVVSHDVLTTLFAQVGVSTEPAASLLSDDRERERGRQREDACIGRMIRRLV